MSDVRMTIPQIRKEMLIQLSSLETGVVSILEFAAYMRELIEETKRRAPIFKIAKRRHPDPDPEMIKKIRGIKNLSPETSYLDIANGLDTSIRCVCLAIRGKRDGSPVYDPNGVRIKKARKFRNTPPLPNDMDPCA